MIERIQELRAEVAVARPGGDGDGIMALDGLQLDAELAPGPLTLGELGGELRG